jgi:3,4-dihydroxy 2-butanone 4-phosphate synthase/GTP cyclohydrolase II
MARLPDLIDFAQVHQLRIGAIRDLIEYRAATEHLVEKVTEKRVDTPHGPFTLSAFEDKTTGDVHLAMSRGDIHADHETLVRVHEPISVLDFLDPGSGRHSFPVDEALAAIAAAGRGVLILLYRPQSGQDLLATLTDAPSAPRPATRWDPRLFGVGAQILRALGVGKMKLMASPRKIPSMAGFGLEITGYLERPPR